MLAVLGAHPDIEPLARETQVATKPEKAYRAQLRWFDRCATARRARRWVEKTPLHIRRIGTIFERTPHAKVILMLRDGRDVAASIKERTGSADNGINRWVRDNEGARPFWSHPRVHLVRYEELVTDFHSTMEGVCAFLEVPYDQAMATFHTTPKKYYADTIERPPDSIGDEHHNQLRNWQINQPLFDGRGRWKKLDAEELASVEHLGGALLRELGYEHRTPA